MNTNAKVSGWNFYGSGRDKYNFLPERGFHYITGPYDDANMAIAAELAVSVAAGDVGGGLSEPDQEGVRHAMGGFFGLPTGAAGGVAILTHRPAAMERAVEAAARSRGVTAPLPIAFAAPRGDSMARALAHGEFRLSALREAMGDNLLLVIVDGLSASPRSRQDVVRGLTGLEDFLACAVVIMAAEPFGVPSAHESSELEVANGVVTFHPAAGEGWARKFTLDRIRLLDGEADAVCPGEAVAFTPKPAKALKAGKVVASLPEPKIEQNVILALGGYGLHPGEAKRWPAGAIFVRSQQDAVAAASAVEGLTQIIIVRDHADKAVLHIEEGRLRSAIGRNLERRVIVTVSDKMLIDPYSDAA